MSDIGGYIVVTFGGAADGWCTLSHCPMSAYGPFATNDKAQAFMGTLPEWQQPHALLLHNPKPATQQGAAE